MLEQQLDWTQQQILEQENEETEILTWNIFRYLQVCDSNKKQITGVYRSTKMPVINSKLKLYAHKPIF